MFDSLSSNLSKIFDSLRGRTSISEGDIERTMREIRVALLQADVALPVIKQLVEDIKAKALGSEVVRSVSAGQMLVKIVQDHLIECLQGEPLPSLRGTPAVILLVGLQGAGKTTTAAKLALHLQKEQNKKVLLASLDMSRPAAREQLAILGKQLDIQVMPHDAAVKEPVLEATRRALKLAQASGCDVLLLDTAGRLHTDADLLAEITAIKAQTQPVWTLLVADALTGQDAVTIASEFHQAVSVNGIILTRMDADARGGAALSMKTVTGAPVVWMGTGEKPTNFEAFNPERIASRILGMGDIVSLVEKAKEAVDEQEAEIMARRLQKGIFDLNDLAKQLRTINKMGGMTSMLGLLPGMGGLKEALAGRAPDTKAIGRQLAIISSMTKAERRNPDLLNASRKRRVAAGSGTQVHELNKLLKQHMQMAKMVRKLKGMQPGSMDPRAMAKLFS